MSSRIRTILVHVYEQFYISYTGIFARIQTLQCTFTHIFHVDEKCTHTYTNTGT